MTAQIVEVVDVQVADGQQMLNVFHFVDTAGTASPAALAAIYIADVIPAMVNTQFTGTVHNEVRYRKVYPTAELVQSVTAGLPISGALGGEGLPTFFAASYKWTLGNPTVNLVGGTLPHIKRGGCRVGQLSEPYTAGDTFTSGYLSAAATFVNALLVPGSDVWELVVASFLNAARVRQHTVQQYTIVSAGSPPAPSTQNTRKLLRGRAS